MYELRWLLGFNLVLSIWLGMLAHTWKGRSTFGWIAIGLCTSVIGIVLLSLVPKLAGRMQKTTRPELTLERLRSRN